MKTTDPEARRWPARGGQVLAWPGRCWRPARRRRRRPPAVSVPPAAGAARPPHVPVPPRIGLALGGGAARGFAHIGVIQVLEEAGIRPDLVVGTSAGSLVAALYAGQEWRRTGRLARRWTRTALTDWAFPGRGLIRGEALARFVREQTGGARSSRCHCRWASWPPTWTAASRSCSSVGDTGAAVRASSAVPAVFQPVRSGPRIRRRRPGVAGAGALCAPDGRRRW
jgi:NTE family protein